MADLVRVRLDLARIRQNLADCGDGVASDSEILRWLEECGFRDQDGGWWLCEEISLESIDRSEILEIRK